MASDGIIVLDEHRSVFNLILLIISDKTELSKSNRDDRNCLFALFTDEKLRLEDAKLILYLFCHHCSGFTKDVSLDDYLEVTGRTMQNKDPIRQSVKRLSELRIIYLDHNSKRQTQKLFIQCKLKRGKITYQINSFYEAKLKAQGRGHRKKELEEVVFIDECYRSFRFNSIRLIVMLHLIYSMDDLDMIDTKTLNQEKKNLKVLLVKYFDNPNPLFSKWIDQSSKELMKYYN